MGCREDILEAARCLTAARAEPVFRAPEIVAYLQVRGTPYKELTIRTFITHAMCAPVPDPTGRRTQDLQRVGRGLYRLSVS